MITPLPPVDNVCRLPCSYAPPRTPRRRVGGRGAGAARALGTAEVAEAGADLTTWCRASLKQPGGSGGDSSGSEGGGSGSGSVGRGVGKNNKILLFVYITAQNGFAD